MYISRIYIDGFKRLTDFALDLNPALTTIVGDNETGKTSVLEAIHLVLTRQYGGRSIDYSLDPFFFNTGRVAQYFATVRSGTLLAPPEILIEAYLSGDPDDPDLGAITGTHNHEHTSSAGIQLLIRPNSEYTDELKAYVCDPTNPDLLPTEYYRAHWQSFKGEAITARTAPLPARLIDTSIPRAYHGPNRYVAQVINENLPDEQRHMLSLAYKKLRHEFAKGAGVKSINDLLDQRHQDTFGRKLTVQMDVSSRSSWESAITPHLDDLPFDCVGKGEQCRVQMHVAITGAAKPGVLLIEEPENHLSHSSMSRLMSEISDMCSGKHQVILATHSAFVLNKLGLKNVRLISRDRRTIAFNDLGSDTHEYFMKLPGYDTLRLILAKRSILVEGPSDELIVQRAYRDEHKVLPLQDNVDVISVGTASKRFLEIAVLLRLDVRVVTDNDGNVPALQKKYEEYLDGSYPNVQILYDDDESYQTLEPQLLKRNGLALANTILGKSFDNADDLRAYMKGSKTECALRFFETGVMWKAPEYIQRAIQ